MQHKLSPYYGITNKCIVQNGYNRSAIYNLETGQHWFIDNKWETVFNELPLIDTKKLLKSRPDLTENELVEFLFSFVNEGVIRIIDEPLKSNYERIELNSDHSLKLKHLSITFRSELEMGIYAFLKLNPTEHLILSIGAINNETFPFLNTLTEDLVEKITLIIEPLIIEEDFLFELISQNPMIRTIYIDEQSPIKNQKIGFCEFKLKDRITRAGQPEIYINFDQFNGSSQYHTYFHKRVHIMANGDITDSHDSNRVFGNINDENFNEIIRSNSFQSIWKVKKNEIDVCNHCEFAPVCQDKRPLIRRSDGTWYSEIECEYNPYISKEKKDENYLSLEECGISSTPRGFRIGISAYLAAKAHIIGKEKRALRPYKG